jgi:hypothetical protein
LNGEWSETELLLEELPKMPVKIASLLLARGWVDIISGFCCY